MTVHGSFSSSPFASKAMKITSAMSLDLCPALAKNCTNLSTGPPFFSHILILMTTGRYERCQVLSLQLKKNILHL